LRTANDYLRSLRDGREVWAAGRRVRDVTKHPLLARNARTLAAWYGLHRTREGKRFLREGASVAWLQPRSPEDLARMREAFEFYADRLGGGLVARGPDYLATLLLGLRDIRKELGGARPEFADNVERYWREARDSGAALAHAFGAPQIDASKPLRENEPLRIVRETREGLVVSGVRWVSTNAAVANQFITVPSGRFERGMEDLVLAFWLPVATPGVRVVVRREIGGRGPLAHLEETECTLEFREALVPRGNVFLARDLARAHLPVTKGLRWASWHALVRQSVKAETFTALAYLLAEQTGLNHLGSVQKELGELAVVSEGLRAFVTACERNCAYTEEGLAKPNPATATAGRAFFQQSLPRLRRAVEQVGGSSLVLAPEEAWWRARGEGLETLERAFRAKEAGARKKARLFRLAWELAVGEGAARQALFEQFSSGHEYSNLIEAYHAHDVARGIERVRRLAGLHRDD
jgi:4-hydroxyphenylacetate 3-monooxygenase/anthranilate 3-monooxygenase (FAD)/4-hydroxyphenylacetate 3-monooxygenase